MQTLKNITQIIHWKIINIYYKIKFSIRIMIHNIIDHLIRLEWILLKNQYEFHPRHEIIYTMLIYNKLTNSMLKFGFRDIDHKIESMIHKDFLFKLGFLKTNQRHWITVKLEESKVKNNPSWSDNCIIVKDEYNLNNDQFVVLK